MPSEYYVDLSVVETELEALQNRDSPEEGESEVDARRDGPSVGAWLEGRSSMISVGLSRALRTGRLVKSISSPWPCAVA